MTAPAVPPLLAADEPAAATLVNEAGGAVFFLACDHAGRAIPRPLGTPGLLPSELARHTAWDIGVAGLGRELSRRLDAALILQTYSGLVIDCNRDPGVASSIPEIAEMTAIPSDCGLSAAARAARLAAIFRPYHDALAGTLDRRAAQGLATVLTAVHSFTPVFKGSARPWHVGVLFNRDTRQARPLLRLLGAEGRRREPALQRQGSDRLHGAISWRAPRRAVDRDRDPAGSGRRARRPGRLAGDDARRNAMISSWSRDVPIDPARAAFLIIDVQNYTAHRHGGAWRGLGAHEYEQKVGDYFRSLRRVVLPNLRRLQTACRRAGIEILYTVIENLTTDGRDRSLDYKISGLDVPKGSWDARILDEIMPSEDEIIFRKTSSNAFVSTNIDYVLRNLGTRSLIVAGVMTDQCVEGAVRAACDLGYLVTLVSDACTTYSAERHEQSLIGIRGYCRQCGTDALLAEIAQLTGIAVDR